MEKLTSHERFSRIFAHKEPDRVPIIDAPWESTIKRWHKEGMPENVHFTEYFDLDKVAHFGVDNSPQYEVKVLEETDNHIVYTSKWGATLKEWKHANSTPEFLDFIITDKEKWLEAKKRMTVDKDRIPWDYLKANYKNWHNEGYWVQIGLWFGFDITHAWTVGTERLLMALIEDPQWCMDMFEHELEINLQLFDMVWDAGYKFDAITWPDDMGYKYNQFFSVKTYRELVKPFHKRAIDWAHEKGIKALLHSCGDVNPFVPELIEIGLDALEPLEVKAGMNPPQLKKDYGDKLVFKGGVDALLYENIDNMEDVIRKVVPIMKESGGYVFSTDHSVPSRVSLEDFERIVKVAKEVGSY